MRLQSVIFCDSGRLAWPWRGEALCRTRCLSAVRHNQRKCEMKAVIRVANLSGAALCFSGN